MVPYDVPELTLNKENLALSKAKKHEIQEIKSVFDFAKKDKLFDSTIKKHIRDGVVLILRKDGKIIALSAYMVAGRAASLTYYWIHPEHRNKGYSFVIMYLATFGALYGLTVLIKSKDISTFKNLVEPYRGGNKYKFIGWDIINDKLRTKIENIYGFRWTV